MRNIKEFLTFNKMLTPLVLQILFWVLVAVAIITSLYSMFHHSFWRGLTMFILSPILIRIGCELVIVLFRIQEDLHVIRERDF